ncbi:MAG: hypothetical protein K8T89_16390 [Planctomycetes bacterium]|nr:hypothetical protein [Planctomycetota bacterium]
MSTPETISSSTRRLAAETIALLRSLQPGNRVEITQTVRVGAKKWTTTTAGAFRGINYLATGVTTDRVVDDDIVVPMVHFTKDNGELSSIAIDENSTFRVVVK